MNEPTPEQIAAAERLGISLFAVNAPLAVAALVELVEDLQRRVAELEQQRKGSWLRK
jgi:precorrin-6x reductase